MLFPLCVLMDVVRDWPDGTGRVSFAGIPVYENRCIACEQIAEVASLLVSLGVVEEDPAIAEGWTPVMTSGIPEVPSRTRCAHRRASSKSIIALEVVFQEDDYLRCHRGLHAGDGLPARHRSPAAAAINRNPSAAVRRRFRGAKWGANAGRYQAPSSDNQPWFSQLDRLPGHTQQHAATLRKLILSRRSGGSTLPGACDDHLFCVPGTGT